MPASSTTLRMVSACCSVVSRARGAPRSSIAPYPKAVTCRPVRPSCRFATAILVLRNQFDLKAPAAITAVSIVARDPTVMRRRALAEVEHHLVDVAPAPAVRRVIGFDDRMTCGVKVFGGVAVRRVVATADMAASPA